MIPLKQVKVCSLQRANKWAMRYASDAYQLWW